MATFGTFPGVQITTVGGGISGVQVGGEEKLVVFGTGDPVTGSESVNDPVQVVGRQDADNKFGEDTELSLGLKDALANGANPDYLYGVAVESVDVSAEAFTASATGTLANAPLSGDAGELSVQDTVSSTSVDVEYRYNSPPTAPSSSDTVYVNPLTGEWVADASSDYSFTYSYSNWGDAFDAADSVVSEEETGVYAALSSSEQVASDLAGKVSALRSEYQLVQGVSGAEPNSDDGGGSPEYDVGGYSDAVDNDAMYLVAPAYADGRTIIGGVGGVLAGHGIEEPIYNDPITGYVDISQKLTRSEADTLRGEQVIPVRQTDSIRLRSNTSTSTDQSWERDYWRRRIIDRVIIIGKKVGDGILGRINDDRTRRRARNLIFAEIDELVDMRLLEPNTEDETRWYVDVYEDTSNPDEVHIDIGVTPEGIVKRVDETITINT